MHGYYLIDLVPTERGVRAPELPEGVAYAEIACPGAERKWSLYECHGLEMFEVTDEQLRGLPAPPGE